MPDNAAQSPEHPPRRKGAFWALAAGCGVGWLAGLAASPVASTVLSGVLGLLSGAALSGKRGVKDGSAGNGHFGLDLRLVAILVLGVAVTATAGIYVRTHNWLGAATSQDPTATGQTDPRYGALFRIESTECDDLLDLGREASVQFRREFIESGIPRAPSLAASFPEDADLLKIVESLCEP